jgi:hypothetical protein
MVMFLYRTYNSSLEAQKPLFLKVDRVREVCCDCQRPRLVLDVTIICLYNCRLKGGKNQSTLLGSVFDRFGTLVKIK